MPKEVVFYLFRSSNLYLLLIISNLVGWKLIQIKNNFILLKNSADFFCFYSLYIKKKFLGKYKPYFHNLNLKGMGYKISVVQSSLVLRLGQSHRLVYIVQKNVKIFYLNRQSFNIISDSLITLKQIVYFLQKFGKKNVYKKKGIFLKGAIFVAKVSSKKSKF